jgi:hypothetical protein
MSYSNSFPQQRPTLNLDFANSGKLDSRISYSRSSTGTYMSNEKALSSENLLLQSENLGTTWAVFTDLTSPTGNQTAPDGTSNAWLLTATTGANKSPSLSQNLVSGAGTHTLVAHLKAGSASHGFVSMRVSNGNIAYAMIDFSAGTSTHGSYGSVTNPSSTVTALGSNWYRLTLTATVSSGLAIAFIGISDGSAVQSSGYATDWSSSGETLYAWGAQLSSTNSKVYDSPTTTQISREFAPTLKTAAANAPRFEYATDGQSEGLLIESQATNLIANSNDFSTGSIIDNLNIEAAAGIAPNGTLSASLLRATGSTSHRIRKTVNVTSGATYSASVYVKASGYNYLFLSSGNTSIWAARAYFDLSNGTVGTVGFGTASIEDVGNGYYRCSITGSAASSSSLYLQLNVADADGSTSFTSNDYGGLLAFGLQFEEGSTSSLISTSGASATRSADSCSVADISSFYTGGPLTVVSETETQVDENNRIIINIDKDTSNRFYFYGKSANSRAAMLTSGGTNHLVDYSADANGKHAVRFDTNNYSVCVNGGTVTDFVGNVSLPDVSGATMLIGDDANSGNSIEGHIKRLALYNVALSDTELQALTSS